MEVKSLMKVALFQGSFNPVHEGHLSIAHKALQIFDKLIILLAVNPEKNKSIDRVAQSIEIYNAFKNYGFEDSQFEIEYTSDLIVNFVNEYNVQNLNSGKQIVGVVRGLRNTTDFLYEQTQEYWNQDLGLDLPISYFIADRSMVHLSSSAIRHLSLFMEAKNGVKK